ncbi:MAG: peptidyl-prolyl cis-trans isomerase [Alphaproteobacteria bacterium]|nr:peptidyl-prolyl cis-trans isomerase [Alphaproteobacteria bacterium]
MRIALLALTALTLGACQPQPVASAPGDLARTGETIGTVNGKPVTKPMFDKFLSTLPEDTRKQLEESGNIAKLQEDFILKDALYQEALAKGVHERDDVKAKLLFVQREVLIQLLMEDVLEERSTEAAQKEWYDSHLVQFRSPQVKVSHILADSEEDAKAIKAELDGGADFATVASTKSKDAQTAAKGGEIGWLSQRELGPQLGAQLLAAEKGAVLEPIANPGGGSWHVFKITDKRDVIPFEEAKEQVAERMQKDVVEAYIEEVKGEALGGAAPEGEAKVTPPPVGAGAPPAPPAPPADEHGNH